MSSWIKIENAAIVQYADGPRGLSAADGWREVAYPAIQWKLDAQGNPIRKTQAELEADAQPGIKGEAEDRQRIGAKIDAVLTTFEGGNRAPLRKLLTRIIMKARELEEGL